jgi:hypothetical protein
VGGMERTLLNYIRYIPQIFKGIYNIIVVQTGLLDKERIKKEEIDTILKENNIELITLDQYNKNLFNMRISLLNTVFNTITETIRKEHLCFILNQMTKITEHAGV